jgi:TonB family protein
MIYTLLQDKKRYLTSLVFALILHILIFVLLYLFVKLNEEPLPEYSGPIFIEIVESPPITATQTDLKEKEIVTTVKQEPQQKHIQNETIKQAPVIKQSEQEQSTTTEKTENMITENDTEEKVPVSAETITEKQTLLEQEHLTQLDNILNQEAVKEDKEINTDEQATNNQTNNINLDQSLIQWADNQKREPLIKATPQIPKWVSEQALQLRVILSFTLLPQGILTDIEVVTPHGSSGYPEIDTAIKQAFARWKFAPITQDVKVTGTITYIINPE